MAKTRKRTKDRIIEVITEMPQGVHLSAQELHDRVVQEGETVSLSTIYRALERLQTMGEVRSIMSSRGQLWESAAHDEEHEHDHLICTNCGVTIEFSDPMVSGFGKTVAERKGFRYQESRFDIFGYCAKCKDQRRSYENSAVKEILESAAEQLDISKSIFEKYLSEFEGKGKSPSIRELKQLRKHLVESLSSIDEVLDLFDE